jgi:outer membrane lipoprotein SlyB
MKEKIMTKSPLILALALAGAIPAADAATPKEQYTAETRAAAARYADDRKLCAEETDAARRLDCNRAAKAENGKALAAAQSRYQPAEGSHGKQACLDCGKVSAVNVAEKAGDSNAVGLLAGGAAGALLGHQVGGGNGKSIATIAGAVGGAYAGKKIQEKANSTKVWAVQVQYDNGSKNTFHFDHDPGLQAGDRVKNAGQSVARY